MLTLLIVTACTDKNDVIETADETQITLTPVDLFVGEAEKLKLFIGSMSGAFKLSYKGDKPHAILNIDIWEHGQRTNHGAISDLFFSSDENQRYDEIEVIITVETISIGEEDEYDVVKVGTTRDSGTSVGTYKIKKEKGLNLTGKSTMRYAQSQTFSTEDLTHVWGIQATSENYLQTVDLSQDSVENLEWGLVFTLEFSDDTVP